MNKLFGQRFLFVSVLVAWTLLLQALVAHANSTDGYHKLVVLPLTVKSSTYQASYYIHNPSGSASIQVALTFYRGVTYGTPWTPGPTNAYACGTKTIGPNQVVTYVDLTALCPAAPVPPSGGSVFGWIWAEEVTPGTTLPFTIFSRIDNVSFTSGFEAESAPASTFTGANLHVIGLRRVSGASGLQTNCFVAALGEATTVTLSLFDGATGAAMGTPITANLPIAKMARFLDIFPEVGDYTNGRLQVTTTPIGSSPPSYPGVIAFCTVENTSTRNADFRMAKSSPVFDNHNSRLWVENVDEAGATFTTGSSAGNDRNRHVVYFKHPDVVECLLGGGNEANLQMILVDPEGNEVTRAAGNVGFTGVYTGDKGQHGQPGTLLGANGKWSLDVQALNGSGLSKTYSIACRAGSGFGGHEWVGRSLVHTP